MADKKKTPKSHDKQAKNSANVTRIKASDTSGTTKPKTATKKDTPSVKKTAATTKKSTDKRTATSVQRGTLGTYFKGAWQELRQVHWPDRRTTWGLTLAVILFSVFFVVLVVLLDLLFQWLFDNILLG